MIIEKPMADAKWGAFYRAATAAGVWFLAFTVALGLAQYSDGAVFACVLLIISFGFAVVTCLHMIGAMFDAQTASRAVTERSASEYLP